MMQQPMAPQPHPVGSPVHPGGAKKKGLNPIQLIIGIMLFATAILITLLLVFMVIGGGNSTDSAINKDKYQALFLNSQDGQVYFGKLSTYNDQYYKLVDIYYVRVENRIQPEGENQQSQQNISLAKLGNELHGPEDVMYVNKDHVLFWENLKEDGQVVKAIREYQKNPTSGNNTNQNTSVEQNSTEQSSNNQ
jgi:hypothetical protein